MYEKYELPIRFTEEQRKKYAEWGIKKEKSSDANGRSNNWNRSADSALGCRKSVADS